jgi:hypothetical protein
VVVEEVLGGVQGKQVMNAAEAGVEAPEESGRK